MTAPEASKRQIALIGGSAMIGGTEVFNRRMRGLLEGTGHQVTPLRLHSHRGDQGRIKHALKLIATSLRALCFVLVRKPDTVIVSAANILDVLAADLIARLTGRRDIVLVCHFNAAWRFWSMPRLVRRFAAASQRLRVFSIATNQKEFFQSQGIMVEPEIFPNFLNFTPAKRRARPKHAPGTPVVVLYAGRILPEKQLAPLAAFLAGLTDNSLSIQLRLVGDCDPDYVAEISAHIAPHFEVVFLGPTDEGGVMLAMSDADIFASFSVSDTLPLNMLEAAAHGLPILTRRSAVTEDVARLTDQVVFVENDAKAAESRATLRAMLKRPHSPNAKALLASNEARAFRILGLPAPAQNTAAPERERLALRRATH
ncbi:MAG: glycosyltransferase family 4 protein [Maritimibacter sp.]